MATTTAPAYQPTDGVLSGGQGRQFFDRQAQLLLGMSGSEFLQRWKRGEYRNLADTPETRNIMWVAYLIPFGQQASQGSSRRVPRTVPTSGSVRRGRRGLHERLRRR